jgi:hypothetical protein
VGGFFVYIESMSDRANGRWLNKRICDLFLDIPGTRLEDMVSRLYGELEKSGICFKPKTYLSDEWGCPHGVPTIGIPFYLARPELSELENEISGVRVESDAEVMMLLRHETGHAFNYAYRLYEKTLWHRTFGKFTQPYREIYKTRPFSSRFVRHVPGWYAQKHPDEDFAETFAVWLTPGSNWRQVYANTPAFKKLLYIDKIVQKYGGTKPTASDHTLDMPVQELKMTLKTWYKQRKEEGINKLRLPEIMDIDLLRLFPNSKGQTALRVLQAHKNEIVRQVNDWTGLDRHLLGSLFEQIVERIISLDLRITIRETTAQLMNFVAFLTVLAMNYQTSGQFIEE